MSIADLTRTEPIVQPEVPIATDLNAPPFVTQRALLHWVADIAKLTKPGQSVEIPAEVRGAVGAAIGKINGLKTQGQFRVAMVTSDTARVWRTA